MIVLFGVYHFSRERVGARKDFCNFCERECIAEQWKSFDCGHVFFIPILPLGTRRRWLCSHCGNDPRARYRTRKWLIIFGLIVLPFPVLLALLAPAKPGAPSDAGATFGVVALFGGLWLILLYSLLKRGKNPLEDERRAALSPLRIDSCPYCRSPLVFQPQPPHCPTCGVRFDDAELPSPPSLPCA